MPKVKGVRISFHVSAIVTIGALTMLSAFAEEARSRARDEASHRHSSEDAPGNAAEPGQPAPRDGKNAIPEGQRLPADTNGTVPDGKTSDGIDIRNGVPPRRLGAKRGINTKPELLAVRNLHRRMFPPQATSHPVVRNSIGVPIPTHEPGERRDSEHPDAFDVPHGPALETPGVIGNAARRLTKADGHSDRPVPNTNPIVRPSAPNHAAINGTGLVHHGSGPPGIGGPTTATTGINGTTIRPQH
jgi:hypothetical protein